MAANSLLYLLLTTGLSTPPTPPGVPVTTESPFEHGSVEKADQWPLGWADNEAKPRAQGIDWSQESEDKTEDPLDQYKVKRAQWPLWADNVDKPRAQGIDWSQVSEDKTEDPFDQYPEKRDQYPSKRDQYHSTRNQYPSPRNQYPSSREQYPSSRNQFSDTKDYDRTEEAEEVTPYWPGFADKRRKLRPMSPQESEYRTEDPRDQFPISPDDVTQSSYDQDEDQTAFWTEYESKTQDPFDQFPVTGEENAEIWPQATEEPERETARSLNSDKKKHPRRSCPKLEHRSFQCEKTCSNYKKPEPCHKKEKKTCVCDGGYVRNKQGKCVTRDQCEAASQVAWNSQMHPHFWTQDDTETQMNTDDDSPDCPFPFLPICMF